MGKPFYLTTTLPYVNADPHIGFALEMVQADIIARYHALSGDEVFFNTGTDEHGLKNLQSAQKAGMDPQQFLDIQADKFKNLAARLGANPSVFYRTTDRERHWPGATKMWEALAGGKP